MARRVVLALLLGFAVSAAVLFSGFTAVAAPGDVAARQAEVEDAKQRLAEIRAQVGESYAAYDEAVSRLKKLNGEIAATNEDLIEAEKELIAAQAELEERASQVYRSGNVGFLDVLMGSESFAEFARRLDLWVELLREEQAEVERVREVRDELAQKQEALQQRREARSAAVQEAAAERAEAAQLVAEAQAYLNNASTELQAAIQAEELARQAAAQRAAERAAAERQAPTLRLVSETREMELTEAAQRQAERAAERAARQQAAAERAAAERAAAERAAERAAQRAARQEARERAAEQRRAELAAQRAEEKRLAEQQAQRAAELARQQAAAEKRAAREAAANELIAAENPVQPDQQQIPEPQQIEVPGVIGQHVDAAAQTVASAGLAYATAEVESAEPAGTVVETDPAAGTMLDPGTVVTLYYSSGPAQQTAQQTATQPADQQPATQQGGSTTQPVTSGGSCGDTFGGVQPHVAEAGCILKAQFGYTIYGLRPGDPGDHGKGLALDVMVSGPAGYDVAEFALANFNVSYVIYEQQIRFPGGGWQPMEDRGSPTQNHMDHVHISFY